mgnify:CR=1 FL=1
MEITEVRERTDDLICRLLSVWEKSVRETHLFLSDEEIENIKKYVPKALTEVAHLLIAKDENGNPTAFMGIENEVPEMLFITPEQRGKASATTHIRANPQPYRTVLLRALQDIQSVPC